MLIAITSFLTRHLRLDAALVLALALSPIAVLSAQSPCQTSKPFPAANRMSEADRNTFIYNLPSKLLTEEETVRSRERALAEDPVVTCLRVEGNFIDQDFWSRKRLYVSDGTRVYTVMLADDSGYVSDDIAILQEAIACDIPHGRVILAGEFDGLDPMKIVHPYNRHQGNISVPAAVIENGPMTVRIRGATFIKLEVPDRGSLGSFEQFGQWHNKSVNSADSTRFVQCANQLHAFRSRVAELLRNAVDTLAFRKAGQNARSPYEGDEARYFAAQRAAQAKRDSAERGDTACTVDGWRRRIARARHQCR